MDPKLAAILQKAKAVENAVAQKNGEVRVKQPSPSRSMFDDIPDDTQYLSEHELPSHVRGGGQMTQPSGGGLFDQIDSSVGGGGGQSTPVADRMNPESPAYRSSVENSKLPEAIRLAMLENPIPQPSGVTDVNEDFIKQINPDYGKQPTMMTETYNEPVYSEQDEVDFYEHPIQPKVKPREVPRTQPNVQEKVDGGSIRKMIAEEIAKALPSVIEEYFDKRLIKENVQFQAGSTTFSGTVSPLPKKRANKRKM
jgi:hypothetical protein